MHDFKFQMSALRVPFERVDGAVGALVERSISGGAGKGPVDVESPKSASGPRSWILTQTVSKVRRGRDDGTNVTRSSSSAVLARTFEERTTESVPSAQHRRLSVWLE